MFNIIAEGDLYKYGIGWRHITLANRFKINFEMDLHVFHVLSYRLHIQQFYVSYCYYYFVIMWTHIFLELSEDVWGGAFNTLVSDEVSTRMSYKVLYMQNIFYTLYLRVVNNFTGCNRILNKVGGLGKFTGCNWILNKVGELGNFTGCTRILK